MFAALRYSDLYHGSTGASIMLEKGTSGEYIRASMRLASLRWLSCFSSIITDHLTLIEALFRSEQYAEYKTAGAKHDACVEENIRLV